MGGELSLSKWCHGMAGEGGSVDDRTTAEVTREHLTAVVGGLRAVLAAVDRGELSCSAGYRNQLQSYWRLSRRSWKLVWRSPT
jgi:hypothetical protein